MNGGMGNWMNNPFAYMMMMAWMRDWNNRGGNLQDTELQNQIASLRIQLEDSKRREQTGFIIQQLKTTTTTTGA